ncbi:MAG: AsmA family protein [Proteobacteria bacterium]|nr:AsmA family protein [Pseudomonadota bacterium]
MRKLIYGFLGLLALALGAVVIMLLTLDLNGYKPEIEAELERATGRDVTIGGDLHLTVLPALALAVDDLTIAGLPGGSGDPLLALPRAQAVVALLPLLSGEIEVERVRLVEPVVVLERTQDGRASWSFDPPGAAGGETPAVSIASLELEGGTVLWRDGGDEQRFSGLTLSAAALSLEGPFEASGSFEHDGAAWTLTADIGRTSRPQVPVNITLGSPVGQWGLAGSVDVSGPMPAFGGQMQFEGAALGPLLALAGLDTASLPRGLLEQPVSLDAGISASVDAVLLADVVLALGETRALGMGSLTLGERPSGDLVLALGRLDADALLAGLPEPAADAEAPVPLALPEGFDLTADIAIDAALYRGQALRQVHVIAELDHGSLSLDVASAQLPGGTDVALAGTVTNEEGVATFRGPLEANSDNLRATLAWLGEPLDEVPPDRLRRVDVVGDLVLQPGRLAMTGIDLRFDSSRLTGALAASIGADPAYSARIALDRINLDAYLAPGQAGDETAAGDGAFAMPELPGLDLDLDASVEQLTYNGVLVGGVVARGILRDGALAIDSLGAADIAGATVRTSGSVDPASGSIDLKLGVQAEDAGDLLRLLGIALPIEASRLGRVELTGEVTGGTDQAVVRQRLDTGLGQASIDGTLIDVLGKPGFDGRVGLRASSYRTLAQAFDIALPEADDSEIVFAADITTDGNLLDSNAVLEMLGLTVRGTGHAEAIQGDATFDVRLVAEHGELADLMAALGAAQGASLGPLKLDLTATGDRRAADIVLAPSTLGTSTFRGTVALDLTGARPDAQVRLQAGSLALDPFLALSSAGTLGDVPAAEGDTAAPAEAGPSGRWSSEPIDLAMLRAFDGRIELTAEQASLQGMALVGPTIVATLADGTLDLERFDGGLFDGRIAMTGEIVAGVPHRLSLDLALGDADARQVLAHFADSERIDGRLYLDGTVEGVGLSQRDLIGSLAGSGKVSLRDGTVEGFDLGAISDRLGSLDDEAAIVGLLAQAGSGGQTPIRAADGTFTMTEGVATSDDLKVVLEGGKAAFTMTADLPRWWIDLAGQAVLTQHPGAPPIPIAVRGPIDAPTRVFDTGALQAFLLARAAETALRKLGGDSEAAGAAGAVIDLLSGGQAGTAAEPAEPEPAEAPTETESPPPADSEQDQGTAEIAPPPAPKPETGSATGGSGGSLLDLLTGGGQPAAPEPEQPEAPQEPSGGGGLDGDALLQELLQSLGN